MSVHGDGVPKVPGVFPTLAEAVTKGERTVVAGEDGTVLGVWVPNE